VTGTVTVWDEDVTSPSGRTGRSIRRKNGIIQGAPTQFPLGDKRPHKKGRSLNSATITCSSYVENFPSKNNF